jgi:hypothetical protein
MSSRDDKTNVTETGGQSEQSNKQKASPSDKLSGHKAQRTDQPGVERRGSGTVKQEKGPNTE